MKMMFCNWRVKRIFAVLLDNFPLLMHATYATQHSGKTPFFSPIASHSAVQFSFEDLKYSSPETSTIVFTNCKTLQQYFLQTEHNHLKHSLLRHTLAFRNATVIFVEYNTRCPALNSFLYKIVVMILYNLHYAKKQRSHSKPMRKIRMSSSQEY